MVIADHAIHGIDILVAAAAGQRGALRILSGRDVSLEVVIDGLARARLDGVAAWSDHTLFGSALHSALDSVAVRRRAQRG